MAIICLVAHTPQNCEAKQNILRKSGFYFWNFGNMYKLIIFSSLTFNIIESWKHVKGCSLTYTALWKYTRAFEMLFFKWKCVTVSCKQLNTCAQKDADSF